MSSISKAKAMFSTSSSSNGSRASSSSSSSTSGGMKRTNEGGGDSNMMVAVRVRPANEREEGTRNIIKCLDDNILIFDPEEDEVTGECDTPSKLSRRTQRGEDSSASCATPVSGSSKQRRIMMKLASANHKRRKEVQYAFDVVFNEHVTQQEVYERTCKRLIEGVMTGYNGTMFAYGATGAGKTHTMLGKEGTPGIMVYTVEDLFRRLQSCQGDKVFELEVSYLEIYNERIRDLLKPGPPLDLREDPVKGSIVSNLSYHTPSGVSDLFSMLAQGNLNRTQHPTDANANSSRSHAVFQIYIKQKSRTAGLSANVKVAKLSLIDLAGSERATATTNRGNRLREGANINRSLLSLGNCINALVDREKRKVNHIPYRDSKLTRLLKDSLGGNTRTIMLANVSPSGLTYDDTHNTLKYANRAKNIKTKVTRNVLNVDYHISKYKEIIQELRSEVEELKAKLQQSKMETQQQIHHHANSASRDSTATSESAVPSRQNEISEKCDVLKEKIEKVFANKRRILELQHGKMKSEKHFGTLLDQKNAVKNRGDFLYATPSKRDKFSSKVAADIRHLHSKSEKIKLALSQYASDLEEADGEIRSISEEVSSVPTYEEAELLNNMFTSEQLRCENIQLKHQIELDNIERQLFVAGTRDNEDKLERLLGTIKKFYNIIQINGKLDTQLTKDYNKAIALLGEEALRKSAASVTWAESVHTPQKQKEKQVLKNENGDTSLNGSAIVVTPHVSSSASSSATTSHTNTTPPTPEDSAQSFGDKENLKPLRRSLDLEDKEKGNENSSKSKGQQQHASHSHKKEGSGGDKGVMVWQCKEQEEGKGEEEASLWGMDQSSLIEEVKRLRKDLMQREIRLQQSEFEVEDVTMRLQEEQWYVQEQKAEIEKLRGVCGEAEEKIRTMEWEGRALKGELYDSQNSLSQLSASVAAVTSTGTIDDKKEANVEVGGDQSVHVPAVGAGEGQEGEDGSGEGKGTAGTLVSKRGGESAEDVIGNVHEVLMDQKSEIDALRSKNEEQARWMRKLGLEVDELREESCNAVQAKIEAETQMRESRRLLIEQKIALQEEIQQLQRQLKEKEGVVETCEEKMIEYGKLTALNEKLKDQIIAWSKKCDSLSCRNEELKEDIDSMQQTHAQEVLALKSEVDSLRDVVDAIEKKRQDENEEFEEAMKQEIELFQARLDGVQEGKQMLSEELVECEDEIRELRRKNQDSLTVQQELCCQLQDIQLRMADYLETYFQRAIWKVDNEAVKCPRCDVLFSLTQRKHHCRNCGDIFCNSCTSKRTMIASSKHPVRVCIECFDKLHIRDKNSNFGIVV
eukprot:Nk52_evm38s158 gene=Nk52_evmTU38s158